METFTLDHDACYRAISARDPRFDGRFTTAFIAEYEPTSRVLSYVNAGHNAPILRRRSGVTEELGAGGLPLGVMEDSRYESGSVTLEPGDMLAAFTDGLVEAENSRSEEYGGARFLAAHTN